MKTIAILHTTPATVEPLKALAAEVLPGYKVLNFVDDSVLPQLALNGESVAEVEERLIAYAQIAEQVGASVILNACSSIGETVPYMRAAVDVPVVRIDEAMAEKAVSKGDCIGVVATLTTTLGPTQRLIQRKAAEAGKEIELEPVLAGEAYQKLMSGDQAGHDDQLVEVLTHLAETADVIVLAQASMARVLPRVSEEVRAKTLTSPRLAFEQVKSALQQVNE